MNSCRTPSYQPIRSDSRRCGQNLRMGNPYSYTKAAFHTDRLAVLQRGEQINPVHVQWSISATCSHACLFCAYRMEGYTSNQLFAVVDATTGERNNNPKRLVSLDKAKEILDDCRDMGVKAVQFTGGGEPTVHRDHLAIMQYAVALGLDIALVTHGALLRPESIEFLAQHATWVRVSIDAGTADTYEKIRRVDRSQYTRAASSLCALAVEKRLRSSSVTIGMGFVVTRDNWSEVVVAARNARSWGADNFRISAVFQPDDERYFEDFYDEAAALCREAELLSTDRFQVVNNFGDRIADLKQHSPDYPRCYLQEFTTYIGDDLNVYRCCNTAYNERGLIGSIANQSFRELWESAAKRQDFNAFDARGCERCQFNHHNRFVSSMVEVQHVNFV